MTILLVNKFHYFKGGSEKYYFTLADAFNKMGHKVVFFSMKDEKNVPCDQEKYFVEKASVDGGLKSRLNMVLHIAYSKEAYQKMMMLLKDTNPDLVILNLVHKQITCSIIDAIKKFNQNIPIVWTMHDLICVCPAYTMLDGKGEICEKCLQGNFNFCKKNKCIHGSSLMSFLSTYEAKQIKKHNWYNKVDLFVCPSEFYKKKLTEAHFTKSPIICLRNPLPFDTSYEINNHDEGYLLYFGRLSKEKGILSLLEVMKQINYKLVILGTGPQVDELKKYVSENSLNNVGFKGFIQGKELNTYIKNSRCVLLPSKWYENGPYSAMEAMALGKPLIVSSYGGLPELVENGKNGFVFNSTQELYSRINQIITLSNDEYFDFCKASMTKAEALFSPVEYVGKLLYNVKQLKAEK